MQIKAAVANDDRTFTVEDVELGVAQDHEVLVKVHAAGMCHTDLAVRDQHIPLPLPMVLGHEGAGIVSAVGAQVRGVKVGDHVVITFASCGQCANCQSGKPAYCFDFVKLNASGCRPDGSCTHHRHGRPLAGSFFYQSSFATYAIAHERNVVRIPRHLDLDLMAPLGCGMQTGAGAVLNRLKPQPGMSIAIFGMGAVGLAAVMAAKLAGYRSIVAVDIKDGRLAIAAELGATDTVNASQADAVAEIKSLVKLGVDHAIDATGVPSVMAQAVEVTNGMGTAVLLGVAPPGAQVTLDAALLLGGRTICSTIEGDSLPHEFIPKLIELYEAGKFPFDKLIKFYNLDQIEQAAKDSEEGVAIKPVLRMPH